jgi:hypothetical protein
MSKIQVASNLTVTRQLARCIKPKNNFKQREPERTEPHREYLFIKHSFLSLIANAYRACNSIFNYSLFLNS